MELTRMCNNCPVRQEISEPAHIRIADTGIGIVDYYGSAQTGELLFRQPVPEIIFENETGAEPCHYRVGPQIEEAVAVQQFADCTGPTVRSQLFGFITRQHCAALDMLG